MQANGVEIRINRNISPQPQMLRIIEEQFQRTLALLPRSHLVSLQYIDVRQAMLNGEERLSSNGLSYAGGAYVEYGRLSCGEGCTPTSRNHMIAIDIDGFDRRRRSLNDGGDGINYTLLHETGHVVDRHFSGIQWLRANHSAGLAAMLAHPHSGASQGPGEHFADAYADFYYHGLASDTNMRMAGLVAFLEARSLPLHPASSAGSPAPAASAGGMPLPSGA